MIILSNFHFYEGYVNKLVKNLLLGEKLRLKLAILLQSKVNCLVFDEPTNRYFINKFADKVVEFKDGNIVSYNSNYEYYNEFKNK